MRWFLIFGQLQLYYTQGKESFKFIQFTWHPFYGEWKLTVIVVYFCALYFRSNLVTATVNKPKNVSSIGLRLKSQDWRLWRMMRHLLRLYMSVWCHIAWYLASTAVPHYELVTFVLLFKRSGMNEVWTNVTNAFTLKAPKFERKSKEQKWTIVTVNLHCMERELNEF